MMLEGMPYLDELCADLGVSVWRESRGRAEGKGWFRRMWGAARELWGAYYGPGDYGDAIEEWLERREKKE